MTIDISDIDETFRKFFCRAGYWSLYKTNILVLTYFAVFRQFWMIWYRGRWWMKSNFCNATSQSHTIVASLGIQQQLFLRYISRLLHNTSTIGLSHRSRVPKANPIPRLGSSKALLDCDIIVNKSQLSSISNSILLFNFYMEPFKKRDMEISSIKVNTFPPAPAIQYLFSSSLQKICKWDLPSMLSKR